ncbi:DUF4917 family protein [Citricoccus muralis]|uniref:DUF4917 family protein n=1 Tax=Citricoccus muralis TaxID=169134 RepID=A0ABY8H914_9MICC|nr:DUF4917 family protein [Citricoccus muralis]WFP17640.1 DUF4917 family protein [Citricoccus muralis]
MGQNVLLSHAEAYSWVDDSGVKGKPHLLLGNGFSVAYDRERFSYSALVDHARGAGRFSVLADRFFQALATCDFEVVIQQMSTAAMALEVLDAEGHGREIEDLRCEAESLKELLALSLASLHPERPAQIEDDSYFRVKRFIEGHAKIYTSNYDLLLYWTLMQNDDESSFKVSDDGFRSHADSAEYVVWNHLDPHAQNIFYLHGALHLYRDVDSAELHKLTWVRTDVPLIDQIRAQLHNNHFPLIVAEGTSSEKLAKIQMSDYLSKGLRSLANIGGGLLVFGLSFGANDDHISQALIKSKVSRIAVSLFGDPEGEANRKTIDAVNRIVRDRKAQRANRPLEVKFFDASSVSLW